MLYDRVPGAQLYYVVQLYHVRAPGRSAGHAPRSSLLAWTMVPDISLVICTAAAARTDNRLQQQCKQW